MTGPSGGVGKKSYTSNLTEISHTAKDIPATITQTHALYSYKMKGD
jgi:hypothetical protein